MLLSSSFVWAQSRAYINRGNDEVLMGNKYIERIIGVSPHKVGTSKIINKLSGTTYSVTDDIFALRVVFSGEGPAPKEPQNGENDVVLTARDFQFTGYHEDDLSGGGKELNLDFAYNWQNTAFRVRAIYEVYPAEYSFRKWIEISDSSYGAQFLDRVYVESMYLKPGKFSNGQYGQPVFDKDIFIGVEYPTVENTMNGNHLMSGYIVGRLITHNAYRTHAAILGSAVSGEKLEQTFMTYVESIRSVPTRPYLLYNSWYDLRNPAIANGTDGIMNTRNLLRTIRSFKSNLDEKYGVSLDGFVLDDGWDNDKSLWDIDSARFRDGFTPIVEALDSMHTQLGLWTSPYGGYWNRDLRVHWAKDHGYETSADYLCLAGPKYKAHFRNVVEGYEKSYHIGYFKWDGLLLACNEPDHGHMTGIYSRQAELSTYLQIMKSLRKMNPKLFFNITAGTWLSPWWLRYADCVWMQGNDYGYQESVPSINDRDKAILYKDAVLWDDYMKSHLLFPMSGLMTHGIIKGRYNLLGGASESLASFSDEVMMYFGRGVMMWELYVSPDLLSANEWNSIASAVKWAKANQRVLENTKMILGDPLKRQAYGYIHLTKEKGILLVRNPYVTKQSVNIKLKAALGDIDPSTKYYVKIIYPYNLVLPRPVKLGEVISLTLDGYEVLTAELIPETAIDPDLPVGVKYSTSDGRLTVYGERGKHVKIETVGKKDLGIVRFGEALPGVKQEAQSKMRGKGTQFSSHLRITVPTDFERPIVALLFETNEKLADSVRPSYVTRVNGTDRTPTIEEGNGTWFWVMTNLDSGRNSVDYSVHFTRKVKGKVSFWVMGEQELAGHVMKGLIVRDNEKIPAEPYPSTFKRVIVPISDYRIK